MKLKNVDYGLLWAKYINIYGQVGVIQSTVNSLILIIMFYVTTIRPETGIPPWLYVLVLICGLTPAVVFVVKRGISGYYRYFNQQSKVEQIARDVKYLKEQMEKLVEANQGKDTG